MTPSNAGAVPSATPAMYTASRATRPMTTARPGSVRNRRAVLAGVRQMA
jgi:hypothetical protein